MKIDVYIKYDKNWRYLCSTNRFKTCKEAVLSLSNKLCFFHQIDELKPISKHIYSDGTYLLKALKDKTCVMK